MTTDRPLRYTSARVERSSRGLVRCVAQCTDCSWAEDAYLSAARAATTHVRATGHTVNVDQGVVYSVRIREPRGGRCN